MGEMKFKTRIALAFLVLSTVISLYLISFSYSKAVTVQKSQLRMRLMQMASLSTQVVKSDMVDDIVPVRSNMNTPDYRDLVRTLRAIKGIHSDIADVYVLVSADKPGIMKFLANADEKNVVDCGEEYDTTRFPELEKAIQGPTADLEITRDRWGMWLSGYAPIKDQFGKVFGVLGIDISAKTIAQMQDVVRKKAATIFALSVIFSFLMANFVSLWLAKPLKRLVSGMEEIRSGNLDHKIEIATHDEFGQAGKNFNLMADDLKRYIAELTETTKEKERLNKELEIAAELQQAMLPHYDLNVAEIDLSGMSLPAKQVGGDYFDYINRDGRNIGFVIADATGKGLNSSIFMTNSKSIFKVLTTGEVSPAKVIQKTNDLVIEDVADAAAMFVTLFYGIYDRERKVFRYCNAGHNPPLFFDRSEDKLNLLNIHGMPIGIIEKQVYTEDEIRMDTGDAIILYTDGVVEMQNPLKEMFGLTGLMDIVMRSKDLTAKEMADAIKQKAFEFSNARPQFDDFTLLIFRIK
jgi:serine phosphatase RsbU (regulator of sigma subunit)